jgi:hypothetical protein
MQRTRVSNFQGLLNPDFLHAKREDPLTGDSPAPARFARCGTGVADILGVGTWPRTTDGRAALERPAQSAAGRQTGA